MYSASTNDSTVPLDTVPSNWMLVDKSRERAVRTSGAPHMYAEGARVGSPGRRAKAGRKAKVIDGRVALYAPPWVVLISSATDTDLECATALSKIRQDQDLFQAIESIVDAFPDEFEVIEKLNTFLQPHME